MSNQPAKHRRDTISIGHSHLALSGTLQAQSVSAQRVSVNLLGDRADVTQAGSVTDTVVANGRYGVIVTFDQTAAAGVPVEFTFGNKYLAADSILLLSATYDGAGAVSVSSNTLADASCNIRIQSVDNASAIDSPVTINYLVIGAAPTQDD